MEELKAYLKANPEMGKRAVIVTLVLLVAAPAGWWFVRSSEEKAYIHLTNGYYYYRNRSYDQSINSLQQLINLYPNSDFAPIGQYYLGMSYLAENRVEEAASQFQIFMDRNSRHFLRERVYAMWMAVELQAGRPDNCISMADRYLTEFPKDASSTPEILYRKGIALLQVGRKEEAGACFTEARAGAKETNVFSNFAFYAQTAQSSM